MKLWRVKPAAQSSAAAVAASNSSNTGAGAQAVAPVLDIACEDLVYMLNLQCLLVSQGQANWKGLT
jgi:hypothetical protein